MDRRAFGLSLAALAAAPLLQSTPAASQSDDPYVTVLRRYIEEIVQGEDVSALSEIVTENVTAPDIGIEGIDQFAAAAAIADKDRKDRLNEYQYVIQVITSIESNASQWGIAYARLQGTYATGDTIDRPQFFAVKFEGEKIAELYGA